MPACPGCLGYGHLDLRDLDATMAEHFLDDVPVGIVPCDECEGTGIVSEARAAEMHASSYASVMRIIRQVEVMDDLERQVSESGTSR